jgi:hypothetical protein
VTVRPSNKRLQQDRETLERAKGVVGISSEHSLPLKRIMVEGLVIVAPILLAFGIDARCSLTRSGYWRPLNSGSTVSSRSASSRGY